MTPSALGQAGGHLGQSLALAKPRRAPQVGAQVAVAELEPGRRAQSREHPGARPGLVADAPAGLLVGQPGEGVQQRVEVGRHGQPVELQVVARVGHDGQVERPARRGSAAVADASARPWLSLAPPYPPARTVTRSTCRHRAPLTQWWTSTDARPEQERDARLLAGSRGARRS